MSITALQAALADALPRLRQAVAKHLEICVRILFISGTPGGGAARSTHELARRAADTGHSVMTLVRRRGARKTDYVYKRAVNLRTKVERTGGRLARAVPTGWIGAGTSPSEEFGYPVQEAVIVENAAKRVLHSYQPDVVVANSLERVAWKRIHLLCKERRIPSVLYMREESALTHLTRSARVPDLLLSNTESFARTADSLGFQGRFVPSIVDVSKAICSTKTRETALVINPIESHGVEIALELAAARPDIPFVFQESWRLSDVQHSSLLNRVRKLPNITFRPYTEEVSAIYADAKILLVPHRVDNRPRVILEAQANGIPVIATDFPGLREAVGGGGLLVETDASPESWVKALSSLWDSAESYLEASAVSRRWAGREEVDPDRTLGKFLAALESLIQKHAGEAPCSSNLS